MSTYKFENCGCTFPVIGQNPDDSPQIQFDPSIENINLDCPRVWNLIGAGNTCGLFQLESQLGQSLARKLKPQNIEHLAALISIMRPSVLEAQRDKKSVTMHYIDRKNGLEDITYFHPALENALQNTYGEMCYQEQAIQISKDIAGFTLEEGDALRKAVGKKLTEEMAKVKIKFLEGCKIKNIVTEEEAQQIFEWIEKGQRYGFNKCVTWDTNIEKENGDIVCIYEIRPGDRIASPFGYTTVLNVYNNGPKDIYILDFTKYPMSEDCESLKCTIDHKILCEDGKQRTPPQILRDNIKVVTKKGLKTLYGVSKINNEETWDLEVIHPQHIYYGNGIAISNSHAISYALNTYLSAYIKAHFPKAFFTSWLTYAREKIKPFEEIHELVQNAKLMNVPICGPDFRYLNEHFKLINKIIHFGFLDIKGLGQAAYNKIKEKQKEIVTTLNKRQEQWSWLEFLVYFSPNINSTALTAIINSGSLSYMKLTRTYMTYEYNIYDKFTNREKEWVEQYIKIIQNIDKLTLKDILITMTSLPANRKNACSSEKRKNVVSSLLKTLIQPSYKLTDSPAWIAATEEALLGIPLTCSSIEACDTSAANCTCMEYIQEKNPRMVILAAKIDRINEIKTKTGKSKGQKMAFLKVSDITGSIDNVVIFPDVFKEVKSIVFLGNNILLYGLRSKDGQGLVIHQLWQI